MALLVQPDLVVIKESLVGLVYPVILEEDTRYLKKLKSTRAVGFLDQTVRLRNRRVGFEIVSTQVGVGTILTPHPTPMIRLHVFLFLLKAL